MNYTFFSLLSGFTHPLLGFDHLFAMVAVGIIGAQIGGKAIWKVPAVFVLFMITGGVLGMGGLGMRIAESGIALSVLVFGLFIAFSKNIPQNWSIFCVALFAVFHGHAHGEEMSAMASSILYITGFVLSTTGLHMAGALIGFYATKLQPRLKPVYE